jgi:hypothetical protein
MPSSATRLPSPRPPRRASAVAALAGAALAAGACGGDDPFAVRAQFQTTLDTLVAFPFRSSQPLLPSAVDLTGRVVVRPGLRGGVPNFDFAFDTDAQGRVLLYPAGLLVSPPSGSPRTGFQVSTTPFDALEIAPRSGYRFDSVQVAAVGQTVVIEGQGIGQAVLFCGGTSPLHAKLVVDSVSRATGGIHFRVRTNPNCGFRALTPGIPED